MKKIFLLALLVFSSNNMFGQANLLNAKNPLEVGDSSSSKACIKLHLNENSSRWNWWNYIYYKPGGHVIS